MVNLPTPSQWNLYRTRDRQSMVIVVQSDLLRSAPMRMVMPVMPKSKAPQSVDPRLLPVVIVGDEPLVAFALGMASLMVPEFGEWIADAQDAHDGIIRALDIVISGV